MAYVFDFPLDVTALMYSMRDSKNWNGDKYRRGSTRPAADWISQPKSWLSPGLTVYMTGRMMGFYPNYTIYKAVSTRRSRARGCDPNAFRRSRNCDRKPMGYIHYPKR